MNAKAAAAVAGATVCVGLAAWVGYHQLGGARTVRSAENAAGPASRPATHDGSAAARAAPPDGGPGMSWTSAETAEEDDTPAPPWVAEADELEGPFDFASPSSPAEAAGQLSAQAGLLENAARAADLGSLDAAARSGVVADWLRLVRPAIAGDRPEFTAELRRLGALAREEGADPGEGLWKALTGVLERASLDLHAARVRKANASDPRDVPRMPPLPPGVETKGAVPMMTMVSKFQDGEGPEREVHSTIMPLHSLFPDSAGLAKQGAPVVEVWTPARCHGSKAAGADTGISVYFVRDAQARRWQPLAMRMTLVTKEARERFAASMPNRASTGG